MTNWTDLTLTCVACRTRFVWSAEDQQAASFVNFWPRTKPTPPKRCPDCRAIQKRIHRDGHR